MDDEPSLKVPPLHPPLSNSSVPRDLEPDSHDVQKLRQWQKDRMARKLRGEYESAILLLGELVGPSDMAYEFAGLIDR